MSLEHDVVYISKDLFRPTEDVRRELRSVEVSVVTSPQHFERLSRYADLYKKFMERYQVLSQVLGIAPSDIGGLPKAPGEVTEAELEAELGRLQMLFPALERAFKSKVSLLYNSALSGLKLTYASERRKLEVGRSILEDLYARVRDMTLEGLDREALLAFVRYATNPSPAVEGAIQSVAFMDSERRRELIEALRQSLRIESPDAERLYSLMADSVSDSYRLLVSPGESRLVEYMAVLRAALNDGRISPDTYNRLRPPSDVEEVISKIVTGRTVTDPEFNRLVDWYMTYAPSIYENLELLRKYVTPGDVKREVERILRGEPPRPSLEARAYGVAEDVARGLSLRGIHEYVMGKLAERIMSSDLGEVTKRDLMSIANVGLSALLGGGAAALATALGGPVGLAIALGLIGGTIADLALQLNDPVVRREMREALSNRAALAELITAIGASLAAGAAGAAAGRAVAPRVSQAKLALLEGIYKYAPEGSRLRSVAEFMLRNKMADAKLVAMSEDKALFAKADPKTNEITFLIYDTRRGEVLRGVPQELKPMLALIENADDATRGLVLKYVGKEGVITQEITGLGDLKAIALRDPSSKEGLLLIGGKSGEGPFLHTLRISGDDYSGLFDSLNALMSRYGKNSVEYNKILTAVQRTLGDDVKVLESIRGNTVRRFVVKDDAVFVDERPIDVNVPNYKELVRSFKIDLKDLDSLVRLSREIPYDLFKEAIEVSPLRSSIVELPSEAGKGRILQFVGPEGRRSIAIITEGEGGRAVVRKYDPPKGSPEAYKLLKDLEATFGEKILEDPKVKQALSSVFDNRVEFFKVIDADTSTTARVVFDGDRVTYEVKSPTGTEVRTVSVRELAEALINRRLAAERGIPKLILDDVLAREGSPLFNAVNQEAKAILSSMLEASQPTSGVGKTITITSYDGSTLVVNEALVRSPDLDIANLMAMEVEVRPRLIGRPGFTSRGINVIKVKLSDRLPVDRLGKYVNLEDIASRRSVGEAIKILDEAAGRAEASGDSGLASMLRAVTAQLQVAASASGLEVPVLGVGLDASGSLVLLTGAAASASWASAQEAAEREGVGGILARASPHLGVVSASELGARLGELIDRGVITPDEARAIEASLSLLRPVQVYEDRVIEVEEPTTINIYEEVTRGRVIPTSVREVVELRPVQVYEDRYVVVDRPAVVDIYEEVTRGRVIPVSVREEIELRPVHVYEDRVIEVERPVTVNIYEEVERPTVVQVVGRVTVIPQYEAVYAIKHVYMYVAEGEDSPRVTTAAVVVPPPPVAPGYAEGLAVREERRIPVRERVVL